MRKPGSQIIVDTLVEQGVETMFGYLGGVVVGGFAVVDECHAVRFTDDLTTMG